MSQNPPLSRLYSIDVGFTVPVERIQAANREAHHKQHSLVVTVSTITVTLQLVAIAFVS